MLQSSVRVARALGSKSSIRAMATEAPAIKTSVVESGVPVSTLSVVVNAGSKLSPVPGASHLLEKFGFRNNAARSALRLVRESELLGASLSSKVTRDSIVLSATFLPEELPYFVNAFGDALSSPAFRPHELPESVLPVAQHEATVAAGDALFLASEALHASAFRKGYGNQLYVDALSPVSLEQVQEFAKAAFTSSNVSLVATGVNEGDLTKFVAESPLASLSTGTPLALESKGVYSGETRIKFLGKNVVAFALPVVDTSKFADFKVLAETLGSSAPVVNSLLSPLGLVGAKASFLEYAEAGLFIVRAEAADAAAATKAIKEAYKVVKEVATGSIDSAPGVAKAQLAEALAGEASTVSSVSASAVSAAAKSLIDGAKSFVAVGQISDLPYADEVF